MKRMTQAQITECRAVIIDTMTAKGRPMRPCEFRAALKDAGYDIEVRTIESMLRTMAKHALVKMWRGTKHLHSAFWLPGTEWPKGLDRTKPRQTRGGYLYAERGSG